MGSVVLHSVRVFGVVSAGEAEGKGEQGVLAASDERAEKAGKARDGAVGPGNLGGAVEERIRAAKTGCGVTSGNRL